jgi:hypothetical protein
MTMHPSQAIYAGCLQPAFKAIDLLAIGKTPVRRVELLSHSRRIRHGPGRAILELAAMGAF